MPKFPLPNDVSRRNVLRGIIGTAGLAAVGGSLAACGSSAASSSRTIGSKLEEIIALAKQEGKVQLIAYPETWANYKGHFEAFKAKYGVDTPVASPDASSAEELQAVKNLKGQSSQPDVLDIGYSFTQPSIQQGLIEAYKPTTFDQIPAELKDPNGMWVGAYYGVLTVGVNTANADMPTSFADLLDPKYKGKIALPGDPRKGASSIATVFAAALANGGSLNDVTPGIDFFSKLAKSGNLVNVTSVASALSTGQASVLFDWNYNFLGIEEEMKRTGVALKTAILPDGVFGNYYAQPITVASPQPNAARLWVEWLTSDEGAEQYALGGAVPARFVQLKADGKLSAAALAKLPPAEVLANINFPSIEQGANASTAIVDQWSQKVGA
ncbi:extracellular solute-binding protein [Pseudarthrobacter sp. AL07]|uniref:ABC transporter substrate-binding protein n=1 Tax=unclassified Pseudarthrobacter TaxID=2647000 RepID=UPI002499C26B|nr:MULTISPECIES: extracellular solute-binding protein [unclassified Pseudarthrobacter]MDI3195478.1 extracellular solute-binding protein [Pseudarthrobacter sp. AL20]MDI3209545.1 extracellular solute-binding protein [Pseudarthrobacter sp. AL07]